MRLVLVLPCLLVMAGCGTITRGTSEQVAFTSEPPGAQVQTTIGFNCPATPCTFEISRKSEFVATFTLPGYQPQQIPVITRVSGGGGASLAGNILVGGVVGVAADVTTGAALDHSPNPVHAQLVPIGRGGSPRVARRPVRPQAPATQ